MRLRRDKNALALFDEHTGAKVRFALGRYSKASRPELVDIKITDYCTFGCSFCYQGSTLQGKHASLDNIRYIAKQLSSAKVFEVALGGGEPTQHPDFLDILHIFREAGVVANYTTKSLGWTRNNWSKVDKIIGAFAFSAEDVLDIYKANRRLEHIPRNRVNIHYVMGLQKEQIDFQLFMRAAAVFDFRVTLLGYKTSGRGNDVLHYRYDWWIDSIKNLMGDAQCPTFSIDTPMAEQYNDTLKEILPDYLYHTREGAFSMYIDAVAMKMGASSFENLNELQPFDCSWLDRYAEI